MSKYLEPDANQARIRSREPRARAKPRARRESGQDSKPRATSKSKAKSQTRIRPGFQDKSHEQEQSQEAATRPKAADGGGRKTNETDAYLIEKTIPDLLHKGQEKNRF